MGKMVKYIDGNLIEYEILSLVDKHDSILRIPTEEFNFENPQMSPGYIAMSIIETMQKKGGMGLSANQVGLPYRVCAINMGKENWVMFNPRITFKSAIRSTLKEGCLSYPGLFLTIGRAEFVTVEFQALNGQKIVRSFEGIVSTCVQHEIDHLDGIFYTQLVSPIVLEREKGKIKKTLKAMQRATA